MAEPPPEETIEKIENTELHPVESQHSQIDQLEHGEDTDSKDKHDKDHKEHREKKHRRRKRKGSQSSEKSSINLSRRGTISSQGSTTVTTSSLDESSRQSTITEEEERETLAYKFVSIEQTQQLMIAEPEELIQLFSEILGMQDYVINLRQAAILDFYVTALMWVRENFFTVQHVSALATVIHYLIQNLAEKQMNYRESLIEFKKLFVGVGQDVMEMQGGLECFDNAQAKVIIHYFMSSFFKHFRLYHHALVIKQPEQIIGCDQLVELPLSAEFPWPPPLTEALLDNDYIEYVVKPLSRAGSGKPLNERERLAALFATLSPTEVHEVLKQVMDEKLEGVRADLATKIRQKENEFIIRINKITILPDSPTESLPSTIDSDARSRDPGGN